MRRYGGICYRGLAFINNLMDVLPLRVNTNTNAKIIDLARIAEGKTALKVSKSM